jgi:hypothetical protein
VKLPSRKASTRPKCFWTFRASSSDGGGDGFVIVRDDIVVIDSVTISGRGARVKRETPDAGASRLRGQLFQWACLMPPVSW